MQTTATAAHLSILLPLWMLTSCTAAPSGVRTWGTLREALRDGHTEARIDVAEIMTPNLVGIGAVAGLDGEITILDGTCYVSRVQDNQLRTERTPAVQATILFVADVKRWRSMPVPQDLTPEQLPGWIAARAAEIGIDVNEPFPFVIEGELLKLDLHVLHGECPVRTRMLRKPMESPPLYREIARVDGRLAGIHARHGGGVITHHGSVMHVHAIVGGAEPFTGHCDSVGVAAGAVLRLPEPTKR